MNERNPSFSRSADAAVGQKPCCSETRREAGTGEDARAHADVGLAAGAPRLAVGEADAGSMTLHEEFVAELAAHFEARRNFDEQAPGPAATRTSAIHAGGSMNMQHPTDASGDALLNDGAEHARARLIFAATLAVPLLLMALSTRVFAAQLEPAVLSLMHFTEFLLATLLAMVAAATVYRRAWQGLRRFSPNRYSLYSLGALAAYGLGAIAFSSPLATSSSLAAGRESAAFNFIVAASLVTLALFGEWFWTRTECNVRRAIRGIGRLLRGYRDNGFQWTDMATLCHSRNSERS